MKTAVIRTGGKQYVVHEGDTIIVDRFQGEEKAAVTFSDVLLTATDKTVNVGSPTIDGVSVEATIVSQMRMPKVTGVKMKAKKRNMHYFGHKQHMTKVKIEKIATK